jgi:fructose-1,6-bisphosphatase I
MTIRDQVLGSPGIEARRAADLAAILERFAGAGRTIARAVRRAALSGEIGYAGGENITGDRQKKLDVVGNQVVLDAFRQGGLVSGIVSEEDDLMVPTSTPEAPYVVCTDPIDGSSNTDIDGPLGTIFSICARRSGVALPQGSDIVAAGYILYGPSTLLAFSVGSGACGFTLDEESGAEGAGAYVLSHPALRCPKKGKTFSANLGRQREWSAGVHAYLDWATGTDAATGRPYSLRYIGALVADLHRCFIEGGLYFYPADPKHKEGKLRMLYECAPLAFLAEQAGGRASNGVTRILEVPATAAHQRSPLVIGSADDVACFESFLKGEKP